MIANPNVMWETFRDKTLKVAEGCVDVTGVPRRRCFISRSTRLNGNSGLYWELRRTAARALRADKEAFARGINEQVTHHLWPSDPRPAYRGIEALHTSESVPRRVAVRAADGTVLTDDTAVVTRWAGYFEQLFKADPPVRTLDISGSTVLEADPPISCEPPNLTEITQVVNQLRGFGRLQESVIWNAIPPNHTSPGVSIITHLGIEVVQQNYGVPSWNPFQDPLQALQEVLVLQAAIRCISTYGSQRSPLRDLHPHRDSPVILGKWLNKKPVPT
ncbi:uncharacterized protein LOC127527544 [Erpetoichthys calabaricus]|uniref:uncharacterized protein LOC127527544 n=1 Tax=Erpetoichthys calabaricus TaxID=27687 RepID=UPI002234026B|nr:uncharacterized protein LOC127527544 [Erpetoichthys calabaricus]